MAALLCAALPLFAGDTTAHQRTAGARLAPPAALQCERNQLTSYQGAVKRLSLTEPTKICLTIETAWGSEEAFRLTGNEDSAIEAQMLWNGQAFSPANWETLKSGQELHAIAWVCEDNATPTVIDWRPTGIP